MVKIVINKLSFQEFWGYMDKTRNVWIMLKTSVSTAPRKLLSRTANRVERGFHLGNNLHFSWNNGFKNRKDSAQMRLLFIKCEFVLNLFFRCELTQGGRSLSKAKFTYRRLNFDGGELYGNIYHYSDSWCTKPSFTLKFGGTYKVKEAKTHSKFVISNPSEFKFNDIKFNSPNVDVIEKFVRFMVAKCPDALPGYKDNEKLDLSKLLNTDISIDNVVLKRKHCRFFLALHPYSYSKTRLERDEMSSKSSTLFFGDIPAFNTSQMHNYQPEKFQYGLSRVDRPRCNVCHLGKDSDSPPILPAPTSLDMFQGDWVTDKCIAVNENFYVTTIYSFGIDSFIQINNFFDDKDCKKKSLSYKLEGKNARYVPGVQGLIGLRLRVERMHLTPYEKRMLSVLRNAKSCGIRDQWKLSMEQDVTSTGGCPDIFPVGLPYNNNVLVRAGKFGDHSELYIEDDKRGMGFSYNLVTCNSVTQKIVRRITTMKPTEENEVVAPTLPNMNKVVVDQQIEEVLKTYTKSSTADSSNLKSSIKVLIGLIVLAFIF